MKSFKIILTLSTVCVVILLACKKEQPGMQNAEDPCECASEVSADFVIEENTGPISALWIQTDTTLHDKEVRFRALEEEAEYKWYIGSDEFETQIASRYFSDQWIGYDIPITLVVKKEPNITCFPNDDGYDSITKTFHVSKYPVYHGTDQNIEHGGLEGTYRVIGNELLDSIEVTLNFRDFFGVRTFDVGNPDGSGINCVVPDVAKKIEHWTYRSLKTKWYTDEDLCYSVGVRIHNRMDGISILDFKTSIPNTEGETEVNTWQYKGRKIN